MVSFSKDLAVDLVVAEVARVVMEEEETGPTVAVAMA
jgi:hypothetical protein